MKRIEQLDHILQTRRSPVSVEELMARLECSQATVYRRINELKTHYQAPLVQDEEKRFYYDQKASFSLPGIRFSAAEAQGLLMAADILHKLQGDDLSAPISRIVSSIQQLLAEQGINNQKLIQFIPTLARKPKPSIFITVLDALQKQKKLQLSYCSRQGKESQRLVSPQHLTYYKNNWYLDAWCHRRDGLRLFAVELITAANLDIENNQTIDSEKLRRHYADSYGLFAGKASNHAQIKINLAKAPWVKDQHWHSQQRILVEDEDALLIELPFQHSAELVADIMQLGSAAEVIAPESLRRTIQEQLHLALAHYN